MSLGNEFKVVFGADGSELTKTIKELEADIKAFQKQLKTTQGSDALTILNRQIDETRQNIKILKNVGLGKITLLPKETPQVVNNTAAAVKSLNTASSSAALALNDVGRIAQDLPYGFIGIQNNLNPLLESFRRVKLESGSTSAAFKAILGSLGGAGGLGLALSAVSAGFLIFQNGIQGFNKKSKDAAENTKSFLETLKDVTTVAGEAGASVYGQIATIKALAGVVNDTNASYKDRKNAIEALKSINKEYFGDLSTEASSLKTLIGRVNEYTQALISQAVVKGFGDEIGRVNNELFKQNSALDEARTRLKLAQQVLQDFGSGTYTDLRGNEVVKAGYGALVAALDKANGEFIKQRDIVEKTDTSLKLLETGINKATLAASKFKPINVSPDGKGAKVTDSLKEQIELLERLRGEIGLLKAEEFKLGELKIELLLRDGQKEGFSADQIERLRQSIINEFAKRQRSTINIPISIVPQIFLKPSEIIGGGQLGDGFNPLIKIFGDLGKQSGDAYRSELAKSLSAGLQEETAAIFSQVFQEIAVSIGDNIGRALAGVKVNPFADIISIIGDGLRDLGKALIKYGTLKELAIKSLNIGNGYVAIAAGIAAVAAGSYLKSQLKEHKFAQGGLVLGPTHALIGEAGPELVVPLNKLGDLMGDVGGGNQVLTAKLDGKDLWFSLMRTNQSMGRTGGFSF